MIMTLGTTTVSPATGKAANAATPTAGASPTGSRADPASAVPRGSASLASAMRTVTAPTARAAPRVGAFPASAASTRIATGPGACGASPVDACRDAAATSAADKVSAPPVCLARSAFTGSASPAARASAASGATVWRPVRTPRFAAAPPVPRVCAHPHWDDKNCGDCGVECSGAERCINGVCACGADACGDGMICCQPPTSEANICIPACVPPHVLDPVSCDCVCAPPPCPADRDLDPDTCRCPCRSGRECLGECLPAAACCTDRDCPTGELASRGHAPVACSPAPPATPAATASADPSAPAARSPTRRRTAGGPVPRTEDFPRSRAPCSPTREAASCGTARSPT